MTEHILPPAVLKHLEGLSSAFSRPVFLRFVVLVLAAILTTTSRTVRNLMRIIQGVLPAGESTYQKVFAHRRWSTWTLSHCLAELLFRQFVPDGIVHLAADDTVDEHPGDKVYGKGCHRDPVRSTHTYKAYRFGHKWVVLALVVKLPFSRRHWALPILIALYRSKRWDQEHRQTHQTPPEILEGLLATLLRWFPERRFRLSADGNFATHRLARFAHAHRRQLTLITHLRPDAALYEPLSASGKRKGRPRLKGRKLPTPQETVATARQRIKVTAKWYGGKKRKLEVVSGYAVWYREGQGVVPIRWVYVHDLTGTHRDEYFMSTDPRLTPRAVIQAYTERWSIEVTFEESRAYLGFGTTRCRSRRSVLREGPFLLWLYSLVVLLYVKLPLGRRPCTFVKWRGKDVITFSDIISGLRRWLWRTWIFSTSTNRDSLGKFPQPIRETLLSALAPAA